MRKVVFCLTAMLALTCASCGNKNKIYPVSGKVTYKGSPASGATIFFCRKGGDTTNDHMIMAIVRGDGMFELVCGSLGKGAPPGEYDVLVEWKQVSGQRHGRPQHGPDRSKAAMLTVNIPGCMRRSKPDPIICRRLSWRMQSCSGRRRSFPETSG